MTTLGFVFDCSFRLDADQCRIAREAGYLGAMRYVYPIADDHPKAITPAEYLTILDAGLAVGVVWESTAGRAFDGYNAGIADAHTANGLANQLLDRTGAPFPTSRPIYYACDTDAQWRDVEPYYTGCSPAAAHVSRSSGVYAGVPIIVGALEAAVATHGWVAAASSWSHGMVTDRAALYQLVGTLLPELPFSADCNVVTLADWGQTPIASPTPTRKARPRMFDILTIDGVDYAFWNDGGVLRWRSFRGGELGTPIAIPGGDTLDPHSDLLCLATGYGPVVYAASNDHRTVRATLIPGGWGMEAHVL